MKLLLVEDDPETVRLLKQGLGEQGYIVDNFENGAEGLEAAQSREYDLIILDIMLPEMSGWDVLAQLRESNQNVPILMLTANGAIHQRVRGLNLGADDYIIKPFIFSELNARIRSLLRRCNEPQPETLRCEDLVLDPERFEVERAGRRIELTSKEFQLLELLLRNKGGVLSRPFIIEQIWEISFEGESNIVEVIIRRLRNKIDDPHDRKLIHTIRGRGYVLH
jgi:two-component system, OmpR family, copper resistance phosphate regulon response regulator CusR